MFKQQVVIFGGPGSGAIVAQSVRALAADGRFELSGFLNDDLAPGAHVVGAPVLGPFAGWRDLPEEVHFAAPLHKAREMQERMRLVAGLGIPVDRWATIIDPRSAVAPDAVLGSGCFIGPFATVGPGARLGMNCAVRAGTHISHDCTVGEFVFVGTNAVVCGSAVVNDGAYIAPNATVRDRCRLGRFSVAGLGSVVVSDIPEFAVVAGAPARKLAC